MSFPRPQPDQSDAKISYQLIDSPQLDKLKKLISKIKPTPSEQIDITLMQMLTVQNELIEMSQTFKEIDIELEEENLILRNVINDLEENLKRLEKYQAKELKEQNLQKRTKASDKAKVLQEKRHELLNNTLNIESSIQKLLDLKNKNIKQTEQLHQLIRSFVLTLQEKVDLNFKNILVGFINNKGKIEEKKLWSMILPFLNEKELSSQSRALRFYAVAKWFHFGWNPFPQNLNIAKDLYSNAANLGNILGYKGACEIQKHFLRQAKLETRKEALKEIQGADLEKKQIDSRIRTFDLNMGGEYLELLTLTAINTNIQHKLPLNTKYSTLMLELYNKFESPLSSKISFISLLKLMERNQDAVIPENNDNYPIYLLFLYSIASLSKRSEYYDKFFIQAKKDGVPTLEDYVRFITDARKTLKKNKDDLLISALSRIDTIDAWDAFARFCMDKDFFTRKEISNAIVLYKKTKPNEPLPAFITNWNERCPSKLQRFFGKKESKPEFKGYTFKTSDSSPSSSPPRDPTPPTSSPQSDLEVTAIKIPTPADSLLIDLEEENKVSTPPSIVPLVRQIGEINSKEDSDKEQVEDGHSSEIEDLDEEDLSTGKNSPEEKRNPLLKSNSVTFKDGFLKGTPPKNKPQTPTTGSLELTLEEAKKEIETRKKRQTPTKSILKNSPFSPPKPLQRSQSEGLAQTKTKVPSHALHLFSASANHVKDKARIKRRLEKKSDEMIRVALVKPSAKPLEPSNNRSQGSQALTPQPHWTKISGSWAVPPAAQCPEQSQPRNNGQKKISKR